MNIIHAAAGVRQAKAGRAQLDRPQADPAERSRVSIPQARKLDAACLGRARENGGGAGVRPGRA